tara:strand:- start:868 stop:1152 length:285 start_codon:yes stop_codon:yes gene_type:complete
MLFGDVSKSRITVDPVVVIPDMLSKNASLIESSKLDKMKGILPKHAILIQANDENKKACLRLSCFSFVTLVRVIRIPIIIVMIDDEKKLLLFSL